MDPYLKSLKKKEVNEESVQAVEVSAEPEVSAEVEPVSEPEEIVSENEETEEVVPEVQKDEPEVEEPATEEQIEEPVLQAPEIPEDSKYTVGDSIPVEHIRIFNVPNTGTPARIISGNVIYRGQIGEFAIVDYMRYGFGMVKGYSPDIH